MGAGLSLSCGNSGSAQNATDATTATDSSSAPDTTLTDAIEEGGASDVPDAESGDAGSEGGAADAVGFGDSLPPLESGCSYALPATPGAGIICFNSDTLSVQRCDPGSVCFIGACTDAAIPATACNGPCCGSLPRASGCAYVSWVGDAGTYGDSALSIVCQADPDADLGDANVGCYCFTAGGGPLFPPELAALEA